MRTLTLSIFILVFVGICCEAFKHDRRNFRGLEHRRKGLNHHKGRKSLMVNEQDFLNSKYPKYKRGVCVEDCPRGYMCVTEDGQDSKCIERHVLRQSRFLYRKHMRQMRRQNKKQGRKDRRRNRFQKFNKRKHNGGFQDFRNRVVEKRDEKILRKMKMLQKHKRKFNVKHAKLSNQKRAPVDENRALLNNLADVQTLLEKSEDSQGHPACTPKAMSDLRTRMEGWFVVMHEEQKEKRHGMKKHHNNKRSKRSLIDQKLGKSHQGKCNCLKSVMWELHHLDIDGDHHLSEKELLPIEKGNREVCLMPLIKSCNRDNDPLLSKTEWCCCFANEEPPCAKKVAELGHTPKLGAFIPKCTAEGYFERMQCHGSTGDCWCSDLNGGEIANTLRKINEQRTDCSKYNALGQLKN